MPRSLHPDHSTCVHRAGGEVTHLRIAAVWTSGNCGPREGARWRVGIHVRLARWCDSIQARTVTARPLQPSSWSRLNASCFKSAQEASHSGHAGPRWHHFDHALQNNQQTRRVVHARQQPSLMCCFGVFVCVIASAYGTTTAFHFLSTSVSASCALVRRSRSDRKRNGRNMLLFDSTAGTGRKRPPWRAFTAGVMVAPCATQQIHLQAAVQHNDGAFC